MPKTSALVKAAQEYRAELLSGEAQASADMVRTYAAIYERNNARLQSLLADIEREVKAGKAPGVARLFERDRLQIIIAQTGEELGRFARNAEGVISAQQSAVARLAQEHARELGKIALGPPPAGFSRPTWVNVPTGALENLAGFSSNGSPLSKVLGQLAPDGAARVRQAILDGVGQGRTHGDIARSMANSLGANMSRTLTVLRTEDMRAYRESSRLAFDKNGDVVAGTIWFASLSADTCVACLMMHGKEFSADYVMETHPNCRCVLVPKTRTWAELGHPGAKDSPLKIESGAAWFGRQNDAQKERILGKSAFEALQRGDVTMHDFLGHKHSDEWGGMYHARSLSGALANAQK